jgi:hypothetical protein
LHKITRLGILVIALLSGPVPAAAEEGWFSVGTGDLADPISIEIV